MMDSSSILDYLRENMRDLVVALMLSSIGAYLIAHGAHELGEGILQEFTWQNSYSNIVMLILPVSGFVFIAAAIIVLVK